MVSLAQQSVAIEKSPFHSLTFPAVDVLRLPPQRLHVTSLSPDECVRGYVRLFCGGGLFGEHFADAADLGAYAF